MEILDKVDFDQVVDELATGMGAPGKIIRADAEVAQIRRQRAEQAQQARQAREAQAGLDMTQQAQEIVRNMEAGESGEKPM